ncbi:hypothetical protein TEA_020618 [Camellia sinensis var. sinensis]|uniref:Uncharacterized protein n=1 Tax=Camellia sinensis var. sinensis TaxID=542762 RepID=A0A4S4EI53_CAMSN|nr:hypothetical protein TEA_020618 [Camellia sinensis var. sinensis]
MADPTPLILSRTESETPSGIRRVEGDEKYIPPSSSSSTLDETIEQCLGDFGWAQFFQAALVSVAWVFDAQQTFVSVFTDAQPAWHLTTTTGGGDTMMMICQLPRNSWAWDMPIDTSIISEWSLECAGSIMTGLPASSFFMGCFAGGFILATLTDSRASPALRQCSSPPTSGSTQPSDLLAALAVPPLEPSLSFYPRSSSGNAGDPRSVLLASFASPLAFYPYQPSLTSIGALHGGYCIRGHLDDVTSIDDDDDDDSEQVQVVEEESCKDKEKDDVVVVVGGLYLYWAMKMLLEKSWALKRLLAVMVIGFGIGMVYYRMPLGVGSLALNLYLSTTFNALSELPASLVTFLVVGRLNRKGSLLGFTTLSGMCSVMCSFLVVVMRSCDDDYNSK